jgi:hypothetical protein
MPHLSREPIAVLILARVHGAAWHKDICKVAACCGDLELLQWLHKSGCPWRAMDVAMGAVRCRDKHKGLTLLRWFLQAGVRLSQPDKRKLLFIAGVMGRVDAAELMLHEGAEWPQCFVEQLQPSTDEPSTLFHCWHPKAVAWARSRGCPWGEWKCQDLSPELFDGHRRQCKAKKLFKWAHKNGCPCTCEAPAT